MKKILFAGDRLFMKFGKMDYFNTRAKEADAEIVSTLGMNDQDFQKAAENAAAIAVIARHISSDIIGAMKRCELIMTFSVGYDCVDLAAATKAGIPVSNSPTYCSDDVANHAMTLILAVSRKLHLIIPEVSRGNWDYKYTKPISNYRDKTLGIIGLGKMGSNLALNAVDKGIKVVGKDVKPKPELSDILAADQETRKKAADLINNMQT